MAVFIEIFVLLLSFSKTLSIEESFCAGTGYSNNDEKNLGLKSAGYQSVYAHPLSTIWAANHISSFTVTSIQGDYIEFKLNLVEQKLPTGATVQLNGWLLIEVQNSVKMAGTIRALALWAATDKREPIGEFLNLTGTGCDCWEGAREILPCSAAPIDASINPNMFVYTYSNDKSVEKVDTVRILWKMSTAHCNKPKKFRFYAATNAAKWHNWWSNIFPFYVQDGDTNGLGPLIFTTPWIEPKFFGAASPVFDKSSIQCTKDIFTGGPVWLKSKQVTSLTEQPEPKWLSPRWASDGKEDVKVTTERATCKGDADGYKYHYGRCKGKVNDAKRVYAGEDVLPICNHVPENFDAEDLKYFEGSFSSKLSKIEKYLKRKCECPKVPTPEEVKKVAGVKRVPTTTTLTPGLNLNGNSLDVAVNIVNTRRQAELENNQNEFVDDVKTKNNDGIQESVSNANTDSNNLNLLKNSPSKPTTSSAQKGSLLKDLSNLNASITLFKLAFNLTTTEDPEDSREGVDEYNEFHKDDAHIKCALQHKNFSNYNNLGLCLDSSAGKIVSGVRQWHATSTLLCTVVLVPVVSYMARYHKGALPVTSAGAGYIPVRVWYIVHILIILPILCLYTTGMVSIRRQRAVLGYSLTYLAKFHRIGGTVLIVLMLVQIITGFLRPLNIFYRKLAIWFHFIIGLLINYGGLLLCIMTYRIPGSSFAFQSHVDPSLFNPMRNHIAPMILAFWGAADIVYQAFITVHIIQFDKSVGVHRSYFPVIIPIMVDKRMQFDDEYEREHSFQKGTLTAYVIFTIFIFFLTCISMYYLNDERGQGFGPMYCTHDDEGHFFDPTESGKMPTKKGYCK